MPIGRTCLRGISTSLDASGKRVGRLDTFRICHMSGGENLDATERPVIAATRTTKRRGPRLSRADRTPLGLWFWEIDRVLLLLVSILRSEEHTSELQSLMRISYAVFCLKKTNKLK